MKVLMIAPQPFFQPRGTPISVFQRLHGLSALGYDVDLLTYHVGEDVTIPSVTVYRTPKVPFIRNLKIGPSWPKILLDILIFFKAIILLLSKKYDVIHSHEEAGFFSVVLARMFRKPHLYDMHSMLPVQMKNSPYRRLTPVIALFERLETWVINTCDAIITIGTDLDEHVAMVKPSARHLMIQNLPLNVLSNPEVQCSVDELRNRLAIGDRLPIVYTGTFERYQGLDLLFESIKLLRAKYPNLVFIYVGGKPEQVAEWQQTMAANNLDDCTIFTGTVSPDEALLYLDLADILVSPRTEGLSVPLKIYTYLYSGKPTVATNLLAHTQVLTDETAMLVDPTPESFAAGIEKLVCNPELRHQIGVQANEFAAQEYSFEQYLQKLRTVYNWCVTPPPSTQQQLYQQGQQV